MSVRILSTLACTGVLAFGAGGCASRGSVAETRALLDERLLELEDRLHRSEQLRAETEARLGEIGTLRAALEESAEARRQLVQRLDDLDRNRFQQLAEAQSQQGALLADLDRVRLHELSTQLSEQQTRLGDLATRLGDLGNRLDQVRGATSAEALVDLQKNLADLDSMVELNQRLSESNRANIAELDRSMAELVDAFNRQMRLLAEYMNAQFVPLAQELVAHLYRESRQMNESAERLEDLARKVDPYKFSHLVPKIDPQGEPAGTNGPPPPASGDGAKKDDRDG